MTNRPRRVFIGLPAYNEEVALPRLLQRIERLAVSSGEKVTTVLYNDGCTDATVPIAQGWQERLPLVILGCVRNKGLGAGLRAPVAYAVATGHDDDVLVVMDCADTHDPGRPGALSAPLAGVAVAVARSRCLPRA